MSLVQAHWLVLGGAALSAIALPIKLVSSEPAAPFLPPAPAATQVRVAPEAGLSYALTAPPFTDGRTVEAAQPAPDPAEATETAAPEAPAPALVGVALGGRNRAVALARGSNGETLTLARGEAVDGWTVIAIGRDRATFERGGARHTARLDFGNRPGTAQASTAPPSPSIPAVAPAAPDHPPAQGGRLDRNPS